MIYFVYAQDLQGGIGFQGNLPWHLPNDLKFFKATTMGHTMLMGRKTFEAMDCRLLPGRKTIVMTQQANYGQDIAGLQVLHTVPEILALAESEDIYIIGGAQIFDLFWDQVDVIYRTVIEATFTCDTHVKNLDRKLWRLVKIEVYEKSPTNPYRHRIEVWVRLDKEERKGGLND